MPDEIYRTPIQEIRLDNIEAKGLVLDIGGGSEAIVSRMEGKRVCAVDIDMIKIREGRIYNTAANWILADGRRLCFKDASFSIATLWFSLAYITDEKSKRMVIQEAHRVLDQKGILSIMACRIPENITAFEFSAVFEFPDAHASRITYRVRGNQKQSLQAIERDAEQVGFKTKHSVKHDYWFQLRCGK